jgi:phenylalanyl-tRNA synthetase beta chain
MTYAFASPEDLEKLRMPTEDWQEAVELINPMHSEHSVMRRSIIPGLLRSVAYNQNHGVNNVHLFETGAVFYTSEGRKQPKEPQRVSAVLAGSWAEAGWNQSQGQLDFFDAKGVIENLTWELNIQKLRFKALSADAAPWLQPGRAAEVLAGSKRLGWLGEVHPLACAAFDAAAPVVAFELDLKALLAAAEDARPYKDVPQYPAVDIDLALTVDESVTAERVEQAVRSAAGTLLDDLRLFDVYRDVDRLGAGRKSLALSLSYRAPDRTLTSEEVEAVHQKVIRKVSNATGGEVRGQESAK